MHRVVLFDIDGVLVEPRAYRLAISESIKIFLADSEVTVQDKDLPTLQEIAQFESKGVHDVWDIAALCCSIGILARHRDAKARSLALGRDDRPLFIPLLQKLEIPLGDGVHPPDALRTYLQSCLPHKFETDPALTVLEHTRQVQHNKLTEIFQSLILGKDAFESVYGIECTANPESLLIREDRVLLEADWASRIIKLRQDNLISAAIYTARPSLSPEAESLGYPPEAEMARDACGLSSLPLVGMGSMEWLAKSKSVTPESLTKPHVVHALSALLRALDSNDSSAVYNDAFSIAKGQYKILQNRLESVQAGLEVLVYEDTISGIIPMLKVKALVEACGVPLRLRAFGITQDQTKRLALGAYCEALFPDINAGLAEVL